MKLLIHHIYEYKKGVRSLTLRTMHSKYKHQIIEKLDSSNVPYWIREVSETKLNIFIGDSSCLNVLKQIGDKSLNKFTDEEDFILGVMLGYCPKKQCERYLKRKNKHKCKNINDFKLIKNKKLLRRSI